MARTCLRTVKACRRRGRWPGSIAYQSHGRSVWTVRTARYVKKAKSPLVMLWSWARKRKRAMTSFFVWQYTTTASHYTFTDSATQNTIRATIPLSVLNRPGTIHCRGAHGDGNSGNPAESTGFPRIWVWMLPEYRGMDLAIIVGFPRDGFFRRRPRRNGRQIRLWKILECIQYLDRPY